MAVTLVRGGNGLQSFPYTLPLAAVTLFHCPAAWMREVRYCSTPESVIFRVLESWKEPKSYLPVVTKHLKAVKPVFLLE